MGKLVTFLMLLLFTVVIVNTVVFSEDGIQNDANEMKNTTQTTISEANTKLLNFGK